MEMAEGRLPMKYLGVPLSINYLKARHYAGLLDECKSMVRRIGRFRYELADSDTNRPIRIRIG